MYYGGMSKLELAQLYLPDTQPYLARRKLNVWISLNKELQKELVQRGYQPKVPFLTAGQVEVIMKYLGEP